MTLSPSLGLSFPICGWRGPKRDSLSLLDCGHWSLVLELSQGVRSPHGPCWGANPVAMAGPGNRLQGAGPPGGPASGPGTSRVGIRAGRVGLAFLLRGIIFPRQEAPGGLQGLGSSLSWRLFSGASWGQPEGRGRAWMRPGEPWPRPQPPSRTAALSASARGLSLPRSSAAWPGRSPLNEETSGHTSLPSLGGCTLSTADQYGGAGVTRYPLGLTEAGSKRGNAAPLRSVRSRGRELCGPVICGSTLPVNQLFPDETAGAPGSASGHCARPQCVAEEKAPAGPGCLPRAGGAGPGGAAQAEGTPGFVAEPGPLQ